jgi:hypothetical protein
VTKGKKTYFSFSLDSFPPSSDADKTVALWGRLPGRVNPDLLAASPDYFSLQRTLWNSAVLAVTHMFTNDTAYAERGRAMLESMFLGPNGMSPSMERARMIPVVSLSDLRSNLAGFLDMNDLPFALDAAVLLSRNWEQAAPFTAWTRCDAGQHHAHNDVKATLLEPSFSPLVLVLPPAICERLQLCTSR